MRTLKVHGTKPKGHPFPIASFGIRLLEWSKISHCVMELDDGRIYHARFNMVSFETLEEFKETAEIIYTYEFQIPEEMHEGMIDWCNEYAGKKNGYFTKLFGAVVPHIVRGLFNKYIKNTFARGLKDSALCTELLRYLALRFWSFKVPALPYSENFSTRDMMKLMVNNRAKRIK